MPLFTWNDSYSVQNNEMDQEHRQIIALLNKLHDAMGVGKSKEALPAVFDSLVQYTKTHFANEEILLQKHNYPGLVGQKRQHQVLIEKVAQLQKQVLDGDVSAGMRTYDFLKQWLVEHIQGSDKEYGVFLHNKGVL